MWISSHSPFERELSRTDGPAMQPDPVAALHPSADRDKPVSMN